MNMIYCPNCGKELPDGSTFCGYCGANLSAGAQFNEPQEKPAELEQEKTRLGVSTALLGAGCYFIAFFGGLEALIILAGYILLFEKDQWLRRTALKAAVLLILFSIISSCVGLGTDFTSVISNIVSTFNGTFSPYQFNSFIAFVRGIIAVGEKVIFLVLGFGALKHKDTKMASVDSVVDQNLQ